LWSELLDPPELGCNLRERAGRVLLETADAPLARLDLAADGARPGLGLLLERAELGLRRRPVFEHLAEPFDQGEIERLGHLGGRAILKGGARLALERAEGVRERAGRVLPALSLRRQQPCVGVRPVDLLERPPRRPLLLGSLQDGVFTLFADRMHLVEADPPCP